MRSRGDRSSERRSQGLALDYRSITESVARPVGSGDHIANPPVVDKQGLTLIHPEHGSILSQYLLNADIAAVSLSMVQRDGCPGKQCVDLRIDIPLQIGGRNALADVR